MRLAVLIVSLLAFPVLIAACGGGVNVPVKMTDAQLSARAQLWKALSPSARNDLVELCKDKIGRSRATTGGSGATADPAYVAVQAIPNSDIESAIKSIYADKDQAQTTIISACQTTIDQQNPEPQTGGAGSGVATVTNRDWSEVWNSGASGYENAPVRLAARVYQDFGDGILAYGDPANDELPVKVDGDFPGVSEDDYVLIKGTITGSDSYETVAGGNVDVVTVNADTVKPISQDRADVLANPATGGVRKLNQSQTQGGFTVTLRDISWTDDATRLRVKVTNGGSDTASLSAYDTKIQQGSRQYDLADADEGASELSDDINPGASKTATLTFERINQNRGKAFVKFDWFSEDIDVDSDNPFSFDMHWNE